MPEGDTVYLTAKRLRAALVGHVLLRGELRHPRLISHRLEGLTVIGVISVGKHLFIRFNDGRSLHSHLRMDGSWQLYSPGARWRRPAHQVRVVLQTENRLVVGFAVHELALLPTANESELVGALGPDLLDPEWGENHAARAAANLSRQPKRELGIALLDQRIMAGIGNLYKNELCFILGVSPFAPTDAIPAEQVVKLARRLLLINTDRPEQATTEDLRPGQQHWVYDRNGKPCRRCGTRIERREQGTGTEIRSSYLCPRGQKTTDYGH